MRPACKRCHHLLREPIVCNQTTCSHCGRRWVVMPDGRVIHAPMRWKPARERKLV